MRGKINRKYIFVLKNKKDPEVVEIEAAKGVGLVLALSLFFSFLSFIIYYMYYMEDISPNTKKYYPNNIYRIMEKGKASINFVN